MKASTKSALSLSAASLLFLPLSVTAQYGHQFANALSTGPVSSGSFIRESNTTLILPAVNSPQTGNLALWPGMGTSGGDLIQALAISNAQGGMAQGCPAGEGDGKWCVVASTLEGTQEMGQGAYAQEGGRMEIHYIYNDDTRKYDQTVSLDGQIVSKLSTDSGEAQGWGTAVECQAAACGNVPAHSYVDTTIVMDSPDSDYINTLGKTGATGQMVTSDGGKTWTIDTITIEASTFS